MPFVRHMVPYVLLTICLSGCATTDLMVKRQAEAEARIEFLLQSSKKSEQRVTELSGQIQVTGEQLKVQQEQLQTARGEISRLKDEAGELRSSVAETRSRVALLAQRPASPSVEIVNQASSGAGDGGPPTAYLKAFGLYSANDFPAAVRAFDAFLKQNPRSDYAPNALYWIGECHYSMDDFAKARAIFVKVGETYPASSKAPDALLKLGYTLLALNEKEKAAALFEKVLRLYPGHPVALKARERLNSH